MKKICIVLADGFEEIEALTQVDYLRRAGLEIDMLTINKSKEVVGAHNIKVLADNTMESFDENQYDAIIIPGGSTGVENLINNEKILKILKKFKDDKKLIAAICAGPLVLDKAGVIKDETFTIFPGLEEEIESGNHINAVVVTSGNIITAKGVSFAPHLAYSITSYLIDSKASERLQEETLYFIEI